MSTAAAWVVVPCFNERARLRPEALAELFALDGLVDVVAFVDDGSTDGTGDELDRLVAPFGDRGRVIRLATNAGKGEAVRQGLLAAIDGGATIAGYLDADLATPVREYARLVARVREDPTVSAAIGSRVGLLGHRIARRPLRHYLGRLYATVASVAIGAPVYDTQCGAKVFRAGADLRAALAEPFLDRWSFDAELLGRLLARQRAGGDFDAPSSIDSRARIVEVPLTEWHDVSGSKLRTASALRSAWSLLTVARRLRSSSPPER